MNSIIQKEFLEHINTGQKAMESISKQRGATNSKEH